MKIQRPRLLAIDDDPQIQTLLTAFLRADYFVTVASEGCEGYSRALSNTPDIIVLDYQMPGWDGLETLRAIRGHHRLAGIPVLMLTACADRETVMAIIGAGANAYLLKTLLDRETILDRLQNLLGVDAAR